MMRSSNTVCILSAANGGGTGVGVDVGVDVGGAGVSVAVGSTAIVGVIGIAVTAVSPLLLLSISGASVAGTAVAAGGAPVLKGLKAYHAPIPPATSKTPANIVHNNIARGNLDDREPRGWLDLRVFLFFGADGRVRW